MWPISWERCGDEVTFDDGATSATGNWQQFLRLSSAPSYCSCSLCLLDREERKLFVAEAEIAGAFLQVQHIRVEEPSAPMEVTSIGDLMSLVGTTTGWQEIEVSQERVAAAMQRDQQLSTAMSVWLDEQHG